MTVQTKKSSQEKESRKKYITVLLYFQSSKNSSMKQKSENLIKNACYSKQMIIFANRITSVLSLAVNSDTKHFARFQIVTYLVLPIM